MTTIREFVNKNIWKRIEYDNNSYKYQCVDLIKSFNKNVLDKDYWAIWNAKDYFKNLPINNFEKIKFNWDISVCKRWDIIIWNSSKGWWYWHIWIVIAYYKNTIFILEQNWAFGKWKWENWDEIRIKQFNNFSWIIWFCRYKNISQIINKDNFDKIVFNKWLYIWENNLKNNEVAEWTFYFLAWYKDNLNWKTYRNINSKNNWIYSRISLITMIFKFLTEVLWKNIKFSDLTKNWIWNQSRLNDNLTGYEFTLIINKTKEVYWL